MFKFWQKNQAKILLILCLLILTEYLKKLPYLNIVLSYSIIFSLIWLVMISLFKLKSRASLWIIGLGLFLASFFAAIRKENFAVEFANFSYYVLVFFVVQVFLEQKDEKYI